MSTRLPSRDDDPTSRGLPAPIEHDCEDGWLGRDSEGRPIPCLTCRPHLRLVTNMQTGRSRWQVTSDRKAKR